MKNFKFKQFMLSKRLSLWKSVIRTVLTAICVLPFLMFFLPPEMDLHLYFHGQKKEGIINVYRSDDAVGYYFRSVFRVNPSTTSAYMKGVHENLEEFRVRFTDLDEIVLDSVTMDLYGLRIADMSGREMAGNMAVKKGIEVAEESGIQNQSDSQSASLKISYDGAYFILQPKAYMYAGAWAYYFGLLLLIALPLSMAVQLVFFLFGFRNPISEAVFLATPAFAVAFGELACGSISVIPVKDYLLNYFAILGIAVFLRFLTRRSFSSAVTGVVFCCIYIANHFVYLFRGRPLLPWDLQAVGTAAEVAGAYDFEMNGRLISLIGVAVLLLAAPGLLKMKKMHGIDSFEHKSPLATLPFLRQLSVSKKKIERQQKIEIPDKSQSKSPGTRIRNHMEKLTLVNAVIRTCGMAFGILIVLLVLKSPVYAQLSAEAWDATIIINYQKQGMPMTFVKFMDVYRVSEPDGYSQEALEEIRRIYAEETPPDRLFFLPEGTKITERPERILMVMNESLSEISYANEESAVDTLPFLRSLKDNTVRGSLYVSVRGGGTCNTEFESLTASAMGLLPPNTYPYEAYLKRQTPTIVSYFKSEGYDVASLHLADRKNWKRSTVYPYLSLEPFYACNNYDDVQTLRGYATDACDYEKLTELDEILRGSASTAGEPGAHETGDSSAGSQEENAKNDSNQEKRTFIFNVTMQNHGGYTPTDDMNVTVDLGAYGDFAQAEVYYSLMKLSDEALQELINHYTDDETRTMIVVYGDHQPSLGTKTDDFLFDEDPMPLVKYETPFVIWANYDLPESDGYRMSANYFSGLVLEAAGFPLTPYLRLVGDCYKAYPVITSYGVLDAKGQYYNNADEVPDETGVLSRLRIAQYNNLFDADRMEALFEKTTYE